MTNSNTPRAPKDADAAERDAIRWLMRLSERPLSDAEAAEFDAWMNASPEHEARFRRQETAWRNLPHMSGVSDFDDLMRPSLYERAANAAYELRLRMAKIARRRAAAIGAAAAAAAGFAFLSAVVLLSRDGGGAGPAPLYTTQIAELRNLTLDDGSHVTLGAASALDVEFTTDERRVFLTKGEAYFDVTKDPSRPFIVATPDALVRVVGTRFDVRLGAKSVRVAVAQGQVEVLQPESEAAPLKDEHVKHVLLAGQSVVAGKANKLQPILPVDEKKVAAWRDGMLVYVDAPLRDIIADLNRYNRTPVELADPGLGDIAFTAAFNTNTPDSMLAMIETALDLEQEKSGARIVLKPAKQSGRR